MSLGQFFELLQISIYYITQMEFFLIKKKKRLMSRSTPYSYQFYLKGIILHFIPIHYENSLKESIK